MSRRNSVRRASPEDVRFFPILRADLRDSSAEWDPTNAQLPLSRLIGAQLVWSGPESGRRAKRSIRLRRSPRVAAVPAQNLRQIAAAVFQHLIDRVEACVVSGMDLSAVADEQLDHRLTVPRVPVWAVQGSASFIVSGIHGLRILV